MGSRQQKRRAHSEENDDRHCDIHLRAIGGRTSPEVRICFQVVWQSNLLYFRGLAFGTREVLVYPLAIGYLGGHIRPPDLGR